MRTHTRGDKRKCALEMMAEKEVEEKEEGVHVQGGRYFGIGSYVSTYHASIQTLFIRCSAVLSFLSTSPPALLVQRSFNAGHITELALTTV